MTLLLCCLGLIALALCVMALAAEPAPAPSYLARDDVWGDEVWREGARPRPERGQASLHTVTALVAAALALDIAAGAAVVANSEAAHPAPATEFAAQAPTPAPPTPWAAWFDADGFRFEPQARLPAAAGLAFEARDIWRPQVDAEGWLV